jgi:hypothetical protein
MTRARTASYGVVTPPPLDRWIEAVLMLCVSLVHRAATTLGMIFNRTRRDGHTETAQEDLPQAKHGTLSQVPNTPHRVMLGLVPSISVEPTRGLAIDPREAINQDARHKGEHDTVDVARSCHAPPLSFRTHALRQAQGKRVRAGTQGRRAHLRLPAPGFPLAPRRVGNDAVDAR